MPVNGGVLRFDRATGTNVLLRSPETALNRREAPRSIQIGLLSPCNMSCSFCYRDAAAPSRLTSEFLLDLLIRADQWGVLEVAFGGGEPLLFKGFVELLRNLHEKTDLGLNFTTNGTLLTTERVDALEGVVGEVRVSAYADNNYRETLRRARRLNLGVNLLVTPENVNRLEVLVHDCFEQGARNVLLLGYKGQDSSLHLDAHGLERLQESVRRMFRLPLRLDICWHPHLTGVDHLFQRSDCGAGDEFLVITPDRAIQPCSFHHERIPFSSFEDLRLIYRDLRARRPPADIAGCTRSQFRAGPEAAPPEPAAWVWQARASNNSGDWTIAARFGDAETARKMAASLRELARAHEAFLASAEGQAFVEGNGFDGSVPTPPLRDYGRAHGIEWNDGLWWEEDGFGAPVLTAGAVGDAVVVYHPYCMGLPEEQFRELFRRTGALEMGYWQYGRPMVVIRAAGRQDVAIEQAKKFVEKVRAAEYPSDVEDDPPWGREARDTRLLRDEDRSARLSEGEHRIEVRGDEVTLSLGFENTFAGPIAVENWLKEKGFKDIRTTVGPVLEKLEPATEHFDPRVGLFGKVIPGSAPWEQTLLTKVSDRQVVEWMFAAGKLSRDFSTRLAEVKPSTLLGLVSEVARARWDAGDPATNVVVQVAAWQREGAAELVRAFWERLPAQDLPTRSAALLALAASLPKDEALEKARDWVRGTTETREAFRRLEALTPLREPRLAGLVEETRRRAGQVEGVDLDPVAELVARSGADWSVLAAWIQGEDLFLARIAVRALRMYCKFGIPEGFQQTDTLTLTKLLADYRARDGDTRQQDIVNEILRHPVALVSDAEGI